MSSTIDELRRLLDERGVEWTYGDGTVSYANNGRWFNVWAYNNNEMCVSMGYLTPEQAIAATLGCGTCVIESTRYIESDIPDSWYEFDLSCGHTVKSEQVPPNYCEECGKRIDLQGVSYV